MVSMYTQYSYSVEALVLFCQFRRSCSETPNEYILASVIRACTQLGGLNQALQVHCLVVKGGFVQDVYVGTSLIDFYAKHGYIDKASLLFDGLEVKTTVTWTTIIAGVLNSCGSLQALEKGRQVHAYTIKVNIDNDDFVKNGLIDMYAKCDSLTNARKVFDLMASINVVSYNAMIEGYSRQDKLYEAFDLFRKMRLSLLPPTLLTFMYHKRGIWAIKAKNGGVLPRHDPKPKPEAPAEKPPKFYPADDVKKPLINKHKPKPTKLRASITPGTVLILLAGRFKGKRVVFLKQLPSGLLLVTGPFKINGVPLRRVNQSYVIGTSTKVDVPAVNVDKFDDKYFAKEAQEKKKKGEGEFFEAEKEEKNVLPQGKKDDQKTVDSALVKAIESVPDLKAYLGARFSLKAGMKPHELVF
ncbi:Translation protein SH3-like domain superfamily [Sesbania bispinosa]|nr:Translation protein SH3-like domain superfamily [Sesbania bispinosa]